MSINKSIFHRNPLTALMLCLSMVAALGFIAPQLLFAQPPTGMIAYVRPDNATGDEIHLIRPDGSGDRTVWSANTPDPEDIYEVSTLSWRPDSTELAFDSNYENWCSINSADLFAVAVDGQGFRRITEAPACAALAAYPKGKVEIPVRSSVLAPFHGFVYLQGASSMQMVSLPAGSRTTLVFEDVADFGAGTLQIAARIAGNNRTIDTSTAVDVVAGSTVRTSEMTLYQPLMSDDWWVYLPTWRRDGLKLGYVLNINGLRQIDANPPPLSFGEDLFTGNRSEMTDYVYLLKWGPTPATESQLLYAGQSSDAEGIYRVTAGSATAGELVVPLDTYARVMGLAWMPDGEGFVYSAKEFDDSYILKAVNIYEYSFATGQSTKITEFEGKFAGKLDVSPDSSQIVFERADTIDGDFGYRLIDPDVWIINRDGSGARLLVENGRSPVWSRQEPQPPAPPPTVTPVQPPLPGGSLPPRVYLPQIQSSR